MKTTETKAAERKLKLALKRLEEARELLGDARNIMRDVPSVDEDGSRCNEGATIEWALEKLASPISSTRMALGKVHTTYLEREAADLAHRTRETLYERIERQNAEALAS